MKNYFISLKLILSRETGFVCKKTSPMNPCETLISTVNSILPVGLPESKKIIFRCSASETALSFFCLSSILNPYRPDDFLSNRHCTHFVTVTAVLRASGGPGRLTAAISRRSRNRTERRRRPEPAFPSTRKSSGVSSAPG